MKRPSDFGHCHEENMVCSCIESTRYCRSLYVHWLSYSVNSFGEKVYVAGDSDKQYMHIYVSLNWCSFTTINLKLSIHSADLVILLQNEITLFGMWWLFRHIWLVMLKFKLVTNILFTFLNLKCTNKQLTGIRPRCC